MSSQAGEGMEMEEELFRLMHKLERTKNERNSGNL